MALDKVICCASLALLAPAIFAVWILIKRSSPTHTVIGHQAQAEAVADKPTMLLVIKPELISAPERAREIKIMSKRAISA